MVMSARNGGFVTLSPESIRAIRYGSKDAYNSSVTDPTDSTFNSENIRRAASEKYQDRLDKIKAKIELDVGQKDALKDLNAAATQLQSAIGSLLSNNGSNLFTTFETQGAPNGVTIQTSGAAKAGTSHTMQVASVATKQTIVIKSKDGAGNPTGFVTGADVTNGGAGGPGFFSVNSFHIVTSSCSDPTVDGLTSYAIPVAALDTLQAIATKINTKAGLSAILTAFVRTDVTGDQLVLQSINPGVTLTPPATTSGNFYVDDRDISGTARGGGGIGGASAINQISVTSATDAIQSIDIYSADGLAFAGAGGFVGANETNTFQLGMWNIGNGYVNFGAPASLTEMANTINASIGAGVTAEVVQIPNALGMGVNGYILRVSAGPGNSLNYNPASTLAIFQAGVATATQVRETCAIDGEVIVDGVSFNIGGSNTLTSPTADISSLTVSTPTAKTTFSITQDISTLLSQINNFVTAVNDGQQFIAQQKQEDAPLFSNNAVRSLANMINQATSGTSGAANFASMGITWQGYTPSSRETKDGLVPAQYLSIDSTTLMNFIAASPSNFNDIKGLFLGTLTPTTTVNGAIVSLLSLNNVQTISQFDLQVTITADPVGLALGTYTAQAQNYGGGAPIPLTCTPISATTILISGQSNTPLAGLSINYTLPTPALSLAGTTENLVSGIQVWNGVSLPLSAALTTFTNLQYGEIANSQSSIRSDIQALEQRHSNLIIARNKKLQQIDEKTIKLRAKQTYLKALQKALEKSRNDAG